MHIRARDNRLPAANGQRCSGFQRLSLGARHHLRAREALQPGSKRLGPRQTNGGKRPVRHPSRRVDFDFRVAQIDRPEPFAHSGINAQ